MKRQRKDADLRMREAQSRKLLNERLLYRTSPLVLMAKILLLILIPYIFLSLLFYFPEIVLAMILIVIIAIFISGIIFLIIALVILMTLSNIRIRTIF